MTVDVKPQDQKANEALYALCDIFLEFDFLDQVKLSSEFNKVIAFINAKDPTDPC